MPGEPDAQSLLESGFVWRERDGVKVLVCRALEEAGFVNGFSTRLGGVSPFPEGDLNLAGFDEDARENIYENRRRFLHVFGGDLTLATAWQVHGDRIKIVEDLRDALRSEERADALISHLRGALVGVKTADCVPVLVGDPVTGSYAAIHAGWRGTAQSIVRKTIENMVARYKSDPLNMIAAIGPAATCENYEIGQDVIDSFPGGEKYLTRTRDGNALIDLHAANRDQLNSCGIEKIHIAPFCTIARTDLFFSYRVEKSQNGKTGRLLSVIGLHSSH